jgi:G3E family GTPase
MLHFPSPEIGMFGRRQRHVRGHRVPVRIVTDATTQDRDTAVVIDDFGSDETLLAEIGCRCCTVRMELQGALRQQLAERERRPFKRIEIVPQGDIAPILRTFATDRALGADFHVDDAPPLAGNGFALTEPSPLSWDAFSHFMATLIALRGADLLQVRGSLNIERCRGPVAVQFMGHLAARPVELQAWPSDDRGSRLEFVTHNIGEPTVRSLFDSVRTLT